MDLHALLRGALEENDMTNGNLNKLRIYVCPDCGKKHEIYGKSQVEALAAKHGVPVACRLPINADYASAVDRGAVESLDCPELKPLVDAIL